MTEEQKKPTLLLATASSNSTRLVARQLDSHFRVITAQDAEATWEALQQHSEISLLICELDLAIDRFGLLERIRSASDSWLAATPLLLLIGEDNSDSERELAFQMGATDFINLPFASAELSARARLHANLYVQQFADPEQEMPQAVAAANLLQQLSQQNFFNSRARQELSFSQRHRSNMSLCKLKLANIKDIVTTFDKPTALSAVRALAQLIQKTLRREDTLCYLGNAQFYLLYPAANGISATASINRIFEKIDSAAVKIGGKPVPLRLSVALHSCIAGADDDLDQIFARLDASLRRAAGDSGNQLVSTGAGESRGVSVDRALQLIAAGRGDELETQAGALLLSVLPLLEFADRRLQLDAADWCVRLRQRVEAGGEKVPEK